MAGATLKSSGAQNNLLRRVKSSFLVGILLIFIMLFLLLVTGVQNRMVSAFISGSALPAKEDAAKLSFMIRDISLQISVMQASQNTFDLNAANYQLQQEMIKLEEVLYRLSLLKVDENLIESLRNTVIRVKDISTQTVNLHRRKLERQQLHAVMLHDLILLEKDINAVKITNDKDARWLNHANEALNMLFLALARTENIKINRFEAEFLEKLQLLIGSANSQPKLMALSQRFNQLGTGNKSVFTLLNEMMALDFAVRSNQQINTAVLARFSNLGQQLFSLNQITTQSGVRHGTTVSFVLVTVVILLLLGLIAWLISGQRFVIQNILVRLVRAKKIVKKNAYSDAAKGWQEMQDVDGCQDEVTQLMQECEQLFNRMQRRNNDLQILSSVGRDLSTIGDLDELLERMNQHAKLYSAADIMMLGLWQPEEGKYDFPVSIVNNDETKGAEVLEQAKCLIEDLGKRDNNIHILNNKALKPYVSSLVIQDWSQMGSLLFLTLRRNNGAFLGCFCLVNYQEESFAPGQITSMETLARYIAIAIENATTQSTLSHVQRKLHLMEKMTGINALRRDESENMLKSATRQSEELSALNYSVQELIEAFHAKREEGVATDSIINQIDSVLANARAMEAELIQMHGMTENQSESETEIDLEQLVRTNINMLEQKFSHINFSTEDLNGAMLHAKEETLSMAIQDLLLNSCLAIKQRMQNNTEFSPTIKVCSTVDNATFTMDVIDNGQGLADAAMVKILEPDFNPFHFSAGERISLAVANNVITDLSGEITLHSDDATSNKARVALPLVAAESEKAEQPKD